MNFLPEIEKLVSSIASEFPEDLTEDEAADHLTSRILPQLEQLATAFALSMRRTSKRNLLLKRKDHAGFVKRNRQRWSDGFDTLERLVATCLELGTEYNREFRSRAGASSCAAIDVSFRLHARSCQLAHEIICLLENGFAEGAHARWRALHEIVVTTLFISKHGNDVAIRYLEHELVESHKGMNIYQHYVDRINEVPFSNEEVEDSKRAYDAIILKYGKNFSGPYGWASESLGNPKPNFSHLEEDVELDHMRPYYKWASQSIHANVGGLKNTLGLSEATETLLLAGPSNSGLTDPAHATALSLVQITCTILLDEADWNSIFFMHLLRNLGDEVGEAFFNAENHDRGTGL